MAASPATPKTFAYRPPRVQARYPVHFQTAGGDLLGLTENVSEQGLRVQFCEPLLQGQRGRLRLEVGHCAVEIEAEVIHGQGFEAGLSFLFGSEEERYFLAAILHVISEGTPHSPVA